MAEIRIPDPRVPMLSAAVADLVAGYAEIRRILVDEYGAPEEVQRDLLGRLQHAADRAADALAAQAVA